MLKLTRLQIIEALANSPSMFENCTQAEYNVLLSYNFKTRSTMRSAMFQDLGEVIAEAYPDLLNVLSKNTLANEAAKILLPGYKGRLGIDRATNIRFTIENWSPGVATLIYSNRLNDLT